MAAYRVWLNRLAVRIVAAAAPENLRDAVVGDFLERYPDSQNDLEISRLVLDTIVSTASLLRWRLTQVERQCVAQFILGSAGLVIALFSWEKFVARATAWPITITLQQTLAMPAIGIYALVFAAIYAVGCVLLGTLSQRLALKVLPRAPSASTATVVVYSLSMLPPIFSFALADARYPPVIYGAQIGITSLTLTLWVFVIAHRKEGS